MAYLNENYLKLQAGYLFPEIARRVREFCDKNPAAAKRLIRCGIGDVTEPLPAAAVEAMRNAVEELSHRETFRGYGPEQGYDFVRQKIGQYDFRQRGIDVSDDEIFYPTARSAIAVSFSIFSGRETGSPLPTRFIRSM